MRSSVRHAVFVLVVLMSLAVAACSRSDEDTAGGAASATIPPVSSASQTPIANTGSTTGASGVSGSLGTSGASGATGTSGGATANTVEVTAKEFEFQVDGPVPAGRDGFVLHNEGQMPHELQVLQLTDGKTIDDMKALLQNGLPKQPPSWVTPVTGTFAKPGQTSKPAIGNLKSGNTYVIACFVPTKKGVPPAELGMRQPLQGG